MSRSAVPSASAARGRERLTSHQPPRRDQAEHAEVGRRTREGVSGIVEPGFHHRAGGVGDDLERPGQLTTNACEVRRPVLELRLLELGVDGTDGAEVLLDGGATAQTAACAR